MRLIADRRSDLNPDGLWIAEYSERPIDGERRDQILKALTSPTAMGREIKETSDGNARCKSCRDATCCLGRLPSRSEAESRANRPRRSFDTFSPKKDRRVEKPELGVEVPSEADALIKAFQSKNGVIYTVLAYKAEAEIQGGSPTLVKRPLRK